VNVRCNSAASRISRIQRRLPALSIARPDAVRAVKWRVAIVAALGLCLALYIVIHIGFGTILSAVGRVGFGGFGLLCLYGLAMCPLLAAAWCVLLPRERGTYFGVFVWARMVREAATDLLPFSNIGGIALGARAAILHRVPAPLAFASAIVDVTTELLAQIAFIALGLAILSRRAPPTALSASLDRFVLVGLAAAIVAGALLLAAQRYGHRLTVQIAARLLPRAAAHAAAVGAALDAIYATRSRVALSCVVHFAAWIASGAATWIAFRLMGAHVDFLFTIAVEAFVGAVRSAAVLVPGGLGVQEAAYALLAPLLGVGAEFGLAVSLLKRARDIVLAVPILLISQAVEGRRLLAGAEVIDPE
jgi:glycosyltransferase 2 family protein